MSGETKKVEFVIPKLHFKDDLDSLNKSEETPKVVDTPNTLSETPLDETPRISQEFTRPSLDFERPKKNIQVGAKVVQNLLKRSRKLFLPNYEMNETMIDLKKQDNKEEKKRLGKIFVSSRRSSINSAFVLLLLLMTRLGSYLVSGSNLLEMYGDELVRMTGWNYNDLDKYISYSYYIAAILTLVFSLCIGLLVNFILPSLHKLRQSLEDYQMNLIMLIDFFISQFRYPTYTYLFSLVSLAVSHLIFMFGLFNSNVYMVVIFRALFGIADSLVASKNHYFSF